MSVLVLTLGIPGPGAVSGQEGPQSRQQVDSILARYVRAIGGPAARRIRSETRRGTVLRGASGRVPMEMVSVAPNRWRWVQSLAWGEEVAYGFDGTRGWVQDARGVARMGPRQALDLQLLLGIDAPFRLREILPTLSVSGTERIGDREATVLLARSRDGLTSELAFDQETGRLVRMGEVLLEDYRDTGGIVRPYRMRLGRNVVVELREIQRDSAVDRGLFEAPAGPRPTGDPVIYRHYAEVEIPEAAMEACVGEYRLPSGTTLSLTREGSHLMLQTPGSMKYEVFPISTTSFVTRFSQLELHFIPDSTGRIASLALGANRARVAQRIR